MTAGAWLAILSFVMVGGGWAIWMRQMQNVTIPDNRLPYVVSMSVGVVFAIAAFVQGAGWLFGSVAGLSLLAGAAFLGLRLQSAQDQTEPAVRVGGAMLEFSGVDDRDETFSSVTLAGRPYLLKFFRGHW